MQALLAYLVVISVGTLMVGFAIGNVAALSAALPPTLPVTQSPLPQESTAAGAARRAAQAATGSAVLGLARASAGAP